MRLARRGLLWIPEVLLKFLKILSKTWRGMSKFSETLRSLRQSKSLARRTES